MRQPRKRNPIARALATPLFRQRVVAPKKGRSSYTRKPRTVHKTRAVE